MNRRFFVQGMFASTLVATGAASLCAYDFDTHALETKRVRLTLGLSAPLRIVVLGDIHFDSGYEESYLEFVVSQIQDLNPDLLLYTGDFFTNCLDRIDDLVRLLAPVQARFGAYACLGNHDVWSHPDQITASLAYGGVRILRNECVPLAGEENYFLTGLDSFWAGRPDLSALWRTPLYSRHLLLVHEPDPFPQLNDPRIKLQISGHTHGGQVRLPLVGALHLPPWGKNYDQGLFQSGNRMLYVNRGIGTLGPHIRFGCRPELTVLDLT